MEPQEARKIVVTDIREVYAHAWTQFAFIKDEYARVRAINGVMIIIDKVWPFLAPKDPVVAPPAATPTKAPAPTPAAQPTKPVPATPPATQPDAVPQTKEEMPAPSTIEGEPAYDRAALKWRRCPRCGDEDIDAETEKINPKTGKIRMKKWQGCFQCGIFLNADGKIVEMRVQEATA